MNCFQHQNEVGVVYCKQCAKPLCLDCGQQNILGQRRVCSEVCARLASLRSVEEKEDSPPFNRVYASVFIVLLLAMLGGIFVAWAGQSAIIRQKRLESGKYLTSWEKRRNRPNDMTLLYYLGITDWRIQFAIGAAVGAGSGLLYTRKNVFRPKTTDEDLINRDLQFPTRVR